RLFATGPAPQPFWPSSYLPRDAGGLRSFKQFPDVVFDQVKIGFHFRHAADHDRQLRYLSTDLGCDLARHLLAEMRLADHDLDPSSLHVLHQLHQMARRWFDAGLQFNGSDILHTEP